MNSIFWLKVSSLWDDDFQSFLQGVSQVYGGGHGENGGGPSAPAQTPIWRTGSELVIISRIQLYDCLILKKEHCLRFLTTLAYRPSSICLARLRWTWICCFISWMQSSTESSYGPCAYQAKNIFKIATTQIEKRGDKGFKGRSRIIWTHTFQDFCTYL